MSKVTRTVPMLGTASKGSESKAPMMMMMMMMVTDGRFEEMKEMR